ncbi:glycoside hydrolase family 99-like domain-containing protein [Haloarchaeobius sp. DFWS5]|uniref:glycoside hydrolase family 99-like domain-containing protein n=1 Tax=Haloarchaeobius sp. DFWS5 TaxID=3446114 RepID=UPI003EBD521C
MNDSTPRRRFLGAVSSLGLGVLGGCSSGPSNDSTVTTEQRSTDTTESPTLGPTRASTTATPAPSTTTTKTAVRGTDTSTGTTTRTPPPTATDALVGAHYYPWYGGQPPHWSSGYRSSPILGEYDSADEAVVNQHVEWATTHGIDWFSVSWWGPESYSDETLRESVLDAARWRDVVFSILYEPTGRFETIPVDFDDPGERRQLADDFAYLAETYFDEPNYLRIDGRPVVYLWIAQAFHGDVERAIQMARDAVGDGVYVLADSPIVEQPATFDYGPFDGVTDYSAVYADETVTAERSYADLTFEQQSQWYRATRAGETDFVPAVLPGFDDRAIRPDAGNPVLERSPERFRRCCRDTRRMYEPELNAVLVTSFNEWHEETQLEPGESYGDTYLDIVDETLATGPTRRVTNGSTQLILDFSDAPTPGPADSRRLAVACDTLVFRDAEGDTVQVYDVGASPEPTFGVGVFSPESNDQRTWRWFGTDRKQATMFVADPLLDDAATLELVGRTHSDEIQTTLSWGEQVADDVTVTPGWDTYRFEL